MITLVFKVLHGWYLLGFLLWETLTKMKDLNFRNSTRCHIPSGDWKKSIKNMHPHFGRISTVKLESTKVKKARWTKGLDLQVKQPHKADFNLIKSYHCLQKFQAHLISFSHWKHRKSHFVIGFSTPSQIDSWALCFHSSLTYILSMNVRMWTMINYMRGIRAKKSVPDVLRSCKRKINENLAPGNESKY